MKVLFVNPPWSKPGFYGVRAGSRWPHFERRPREPGRPLPYLPFPFYMAYAAALLLREKMPVSVIDAVADDLDPETFYRDVSARSPEVVVQEVSTPSIASDLEHASRLKRENPACRVVLCGPHEPMRDSVFLENAPSVDFVLNGEYEHTLLELVRELQKNRPELGGIQGLVYRENGNIQNNPPRDVKRSLDDFPWPARDLFPMERYRDDVGGLPMPSLQVWASRGCPFHCNFCLWPQIMYGGNRYRTRDPEDVAAEIVHCVERWGYRSFYFDDDTFNIGKPRVLALASALKKSGLGLPFAVMARADTMDEEQLVALKEAGLFSLKYGVESGEQALVDGCGKALDLEKVEKTVALTRRLGIRVHCTFAFGLAGETWKTVDKTIDFALRLDPDTIQFSVITPFPGSRYYRELDEKGYLLSQNWEDFNGYTRAVIRTDALDANDLEAALARANRAWRGHRHLKSGEFRPERSCEAFSSILPEAPVLLLYSSFPEHVREVLQVLAEKVDLRRVFLIVTEAHWRDAQTEFAPVKKTLVPGERFEPENLERCLEAHPRARVVVPVNNPGGAGYEALLKCLRDRGAEKTIAVDVLGDVLTSAYRPVSQTRGEKPNPEASGGSLEGKRRGKEHAS